jgi:hypothetical protein
MAGVKRTRAHSVFISVKEKDNGERKVREG